MATPKQVIDKFNKMIRAGKNPKKPLRAIGILVRASVQKNFREGGRPKKWKKSMGAKKFGRKTMIMSNELWKSIGFNVQKNTVTVGTSKIYAALSHFGGIVKPKNKKYLTVPVGLTEGEIRQGKKAKEFDNTFIAKDMIFQKIGKNEIKPLFALKESVKIPARPFLVIQNKDRENILAILSKHVTGAYK